MDWKETYFAAKTGVVWYRTGDRVLEITGADRIAWLQGQVTNDITVADSCSFCLCSPTGQLQGIATVFVEDERLVVIGDPTSIEILQIRLEKMVILEDVSCRLLRGTLMSIQGIVASPQGISYLHPRISDVGLDVLVPPDEEFEFEGVRLEPEALEVLMLERGIPVLGIDTNEKTLPPELGPAFISKHVHYEKGCYTGQEVLARIHSRGHVNKTWSLIQCEAEAEVGQAIWFQDKEVGVVTSACESPELGFLARGYLRDPAHVAGAKVYVHRSKACVL